MAITLITGQTTDIENLVARRGETFREELNSFTDADGNPIDVSSWSFTMTVKSEGDTVVTWGMGDLQVNGTDTVETNLQPVALTEDVYTYEAVADRGVGLTPWLFKKGKLYLYD